MSVENNNIKVYAENATSTDTYEPESTQGKYYPNSVWDGLNDRANGAVPSTPASSIAYNTVLRQCSYMARLLGTAVATRFTDVTVYPDNLAGTSVNDDADVLGKLFSTTKFLQPGEVKTVHIDSNAVTTEKLADLCVTNKKLSTALIESGSSSANNISVELSQNSVDDSANRGKFSIKITNTSVDKSDTVKINERTWGSVMRLTGLASLPSGEESSIYASPVFDSSVYYDDNGLHSSKMIEGVSFNATSDRRLKSDIVYHDIDADRILQSVDVCTFKYNNDPSTTHIGVIAQDLEAICPELVNADKDGYLSVKESKLVYILWESLQKALRRIDDLEKRL